jgi:DNA polymerase-3 subunit epsilon
VSLIEARYGVDAAAWLATKALSFDTETTGPKPEEARLVTAHAVEVGADGSRELGSWLVNPCVPIPPEATAIHGITNEQAARGAPLSHALPQIVATLEAFWELGEPVVAFNAPYDLTLVQYEAQRAGLKPVRVGYVLDPLVIDRGAEPYRKGRRNLATLAGHYGVKQESAHDARGDALTAARILWKQARRHRALFEMSLKEMQEWQREAHQKWATGFQAYLRSQGKDDVVDLDWPVKGAA